MIAQLECSPNEGWTDFKFFVAASGNVFWQSSTVGDL